MGNLLNLNNEDSAQDIARAARIGMRRTKEELAGFNPVYLNRAQRELYNNAVRVTGVRAGRGTGKTTMLGIHTAQVGQSIPRGTGLFLTPSLKSCFTKLQPALVKSMEQVLGLYEGIHYVRERPNPKWHWPTPLAKPRTYDNSLSFYTGHITYFTSIQSKASGNGLNLTDCTADEFRYIDYQKFIEEVRPAIRGEMYFNPGWTDRNYLYKSIFLMSDAAVTQRQLVWENELRKLITHAENEKLIDMLIEYERNPELMLLPGFVEALNRQKARCVNLFEYSTLYNIEVLGEDYIAALKMDMPKMLFDVQIMSQPLDGGGDADAFYFCFNPEVHLYQPDEWAETCAILGDSNNVHKRKNGYGGTLEWEAPDLTKTSLHAGDDLYDVDIEAKYPLCLSFDLNANFNTVVVSQRIPHGNRVEIRIVNCLFTKYQEKLRALLAKFCAYYANHRKRNKELVIISDATMNQGGSYALEGVDTKYIHVIQTVLKNAGWDLKMENLGRPMLHEEKFQLLNDLLAGHTLFDVRIKHEIDFLILAISKARVIRTNKGPMKDKSAEKLKSESENSIGQKLEERTDVTDAFDQALIGAVKGTLGNSPRGTAGVIFSRPTILM